MKIKYLIPLLLIAFVFASCSSEDQAIPETDSNLVITVEKGPSYGSGEVPEGGCECDENYVFPEESYTITYQQVHVVFDSSLSLDEIHCVKYPYFECLHKGSLFVQDLQPDMDPYTETWLWHRGKPLGDLVSDICEDPLTNAPQCRD